MRIPRFTHAFVLAAALLATPALAQSTIAVRGQTLSFDRAASAQQARPQNHVTTEAYLDWEEVSAPRLSPDGTQIIFSRRWVDKMNDRWETSVWIMNADGSHARQLVQGSDVKWSPDGKRIAYIAKGEPSGQQIFVRWMDAEGAVTQISHLTESPSASSGRRTARRSRSRATSRCATAGAFRCPRRPRARSGSSRRRS